jgi:hypothetical protein
MHLVREHCQRRSEDIGFACISTGEENAVLEKTIQARSEIVVSLILPSMRGALRVALMSTKAGISNVLTTPFENFTRWLCSPLDTEIFGNAAQNAFLSDINMHRETMKKLLGRAIVDSVVSEFRSLSDVVAGIADYFVVENKRKGFSFADLQFLKPVEKLRGAHGESM